MARAGLSRDRVTFQRMSSTADVYGNLTGDWFDHARRYAHFIARLGKQDIEQGVLQDVAVATTRVRVDTTTKGITAADRVFARGIYWTTAPIMKVYSKGDLLKMNLEKGIAT